MGTADHTLRKIPAEAGKALANWGTVVSVRGSVVDVRFDGRLPFIYSMLHANEGKVAIEVLSQLDAHRVRGIALTPTQGLARGVVVEDTGGPLKAPVRSIPTSVRIGRPVANTACCEKHRGSIASTC